ncbi:hypothetical protein DFQ27_003059 [Actinomortierella ambigua]|uniref:carbonic anhydrase n=1 Tax=Actinomortierella ambigua TaxID=1343610 RepID=A0A9P6U6F8_9FUNG|nr:hypothetical protein DFQ27_003059 [Actinomortierella ambigua]
MKLSLSVAAISAASLLSTVFAQLPFTYGADDSGPQHWGDLNPQWEKCKSGQSQSPIDVEAEPTYVQTANGTFKYNYEPITNAVIGFNGHSVQVDWTQPTDTNKTSWIELDDGKRYTLTQFHFHTPSEHRVNNRFADGEMHLVHSAPDNTTAVLGLFLELRISNNPWFDWISELDNEVDDLPSGTDTTQTKLSIESIDLPALANATNGFAHRWTYAGSLTTPPCTEGVTWHIVKEPLQLGIEQFNALDDLQGFNSRYIQDRP